MAREIPGFYYDEEKGKYFRIQQSHRVVPGTGHTIQSIKAAQQVKQGVEREKNRTKRQHLGKIQRSPIFLYSTSPLLNRLGSNVRQNTEEFLKQYGFGLSRSCIGGGSTVRRDDEGFLGSSFSITRSGILRASCRHHSIENEAVDYPRISFDNYLTRTPRVAEIIETIYDTVGGEHAIVSTDGSSRFIIKPIDAQGQIEHVYIEMNVSTWGVETIWDIASSPASSTIAIATDSGLMVGRYREDSVTSVFGCRDLSRKEQMNVNFKDVNVIMSGERSGRINFTDARMAQSIVRLLHSSAVLGTLALRNGNQVLAHGYSTTSTYDLRFVQQVPVKVKARSTNPAKHSRAYLKYAVPHDRWSDHYSRGRKVAYSSDLDLVAAANCNVSQLRPMSYVTLYSARTGRAIESPLTRHQYSDDVKCLDIRRVRDGPESVFCLSGNTLDEWAFGKISYEEANAYGFECNQDRQLLHSLKPLELSFEQEWGTSGVSN